MSDKLICGFTPTLNRPELLGRMIRCFLNQTYENRFLVILDDLGQYENQRGDRWELVSVPRRIVSLGEKNNCAIAMAPRGTFGLVKMDDDDVYWPHHFEAHAEALERRWWCQPRIAIDTVDGNRTLIETFNRRDTGSLAFHGQWSMRRLLLDLFGGYGHEYAGDDGELQTRVRRAYGGHPYLEPADFDRTKYGPSYEYSRALQGRISEAGGSEEAYWNQAPKTVEYVGKVKVWDEVEYPPIPTTVVERGW